MFSIEAKEKIYGLAIMRHSYLVLQFMRAKILLSIGKIYEGTKVFMSAYRIIKENTLLKSGKKKLDHKFKINYENLFEKIKENYIFKAGANKLLLSFRKSGLTKKIQNEFLEYDISNRAALKFPRKNDFPERQGDLIILKKDNMRNNEKGVILIAFSEAMARFAALFCVEELAKKYFFVFEPSWWGYQNPFFLLYLNIDTDVVIQSPYENDYNFIKSLNNNFHPSRLGAGDWVDPEKFTDGKNLNKKYDIVMVGNWGKGKRHYLLFQAVKKMTPKPRIALIGYPLKGRSLHDVINDAKLNGVYEMCEFFENISPEEVAKVLRHSKVNVLLSKGEGANRGIYEGMFCGNVIVVYNIIRGVNLTNINEYTGFTATEENLHEILDYAIKNYKTFDARGWALSNTGYANATAHLNAQLKDISTSKGYNWTCDIVPKKNFPNLMYAKDDDRFEMLTEYLNIRNFLFH